MRVRWNRQLDGSLTRRQAEEEAAATAAAATAQLSKEKPKSTPKFFRIFRRKKHHRRPEEEGDRSPDPTPSEADDEEDCASISSVASQPVTELCHRDRTLSLFSSFRLNFPGGKKKSKRGTTLFQENEPENNRYSSPDLVREKLAARPQTELSKSSPSVRNGDDSTTSIPGDFPSLGELRAETSVSFQQLKHAGAKTSGPDVAKLAKSVSFSDCQATLNSKQVTCASARTLRTPNGQLEPKTKRCLSRSTEVQEKICESKCKLTSDGNDSVRLPTQPSSWRSAAESNKIKTEGAMSEIVSSSSHRVDESSKEAPRDKCVANDVREKWFSEVHHTNRDGDLFEKGAEGAKICSISEKPNVILNGNSIVACNGRVSKDTCSKKFSHVNDVSCDMLRGSSYANSSDGLRTSPAQLLDNSDKVGNINNFKQVPKYHKMQDENNKYDNSLLMKSTSSQLLKNIDLESSATDASVADSFADEVNKSDVKSSTVNVPSVSQNSNDSTHASPPIVNSQKKVLCNGELKKYASTSVKSNCVESDVCYSVSNTKFSEVSDLNALPDNEKRLLNEMLRDFGLNTDENEAYNVSIDMHPNFEGLNKNTLKTESAFENSIPLNTLSLENHELNFINEFNENLLNIPNNNLPFSDETVKVQSLTNNSIDKFINEDKQVSENFVTSRGSDFIPCVTDANVTDSNDSDITMTAKITFSPVAPTNIVKINEPSTSVINDNRESICVQTNDLSQLKSTQGAVVIDKNITTDKILEPGFLSNDLIPNEDKLMPSVIIDNLESNTSIVSELKNIKLFNVLPFKQSCGPLFLTCLQLDKNVINDSLLHFNFLSLMPENIDLYSLCSSCSRFKKSSVLNPTCPILHLDDLNNNALCDVKSYLHKLTEASNDSICHLQKNSDSDKHARSVTVWNASFVESLISPFEILPCQQQCIDSPGGRALSDHVPSSYTTGCGKHRLEERCPDVSNPSGSSSNSVTLERSDLHTDGIDTAPNARDGSEMVSKVGASVAFCEKSCTSPSVFLNDDQIKDNCAEIYDCSSHTDVCDKNLVSPSSESYNSFTTESCTDSEIMLSDDSRETKSSSNLLKFASRPNVEVTVNGRCSENASDLISLESETMHYGMPVSDLISNGYCSQMDMDIESSIQSETEYVDSASNSHESTSELNNKDQLIVNGSNSIETSLDLSHVIDTTHVDEINNDFSISNTIIPNGYHSVGNLRMESPKEICDTFMPLSECEEQAVNQEANESKINDVQEKIQFFETGSPEISVDNIFERSSAIKTASARRKSLEKNKTSMIPSLKKACLNVVSEKQSQPVKLDRKKFENAGINQPSIDNNLSIIEPETIDEFENILPKNDTSSDHNAVFNYCVKDQNWSLDPEYKHLYDSGADDKHNFITEIGGVSSELAKRCRSEELLSSLSEKSQVQKFKSRLQTRRYSSTDTNSCDIARKGCKVPERVLTTDPDSPVNLNLEKEASESSLQRSSNLTLNEVQGVQGQVEYGLQSRCASLPLVIGQVRATSPLNYARRNCPIKDASRGKSRIPRKQSGMRGALHTKPVRPPMWLSKAELTAEIQRLGTLCEARTKELNRLKMETKHVTVGFDAFASLFKYMVEDMNALSMPVLAEDLKKTLKQLELAKQDLAYYEREVEEMKAHHCQELNDLSNKLFEVFHGEVTELSTKHQEEMNRLKSDHQQQIENLSTTFDATSQESLAKHEAAVVKLQQELISQREELQQLHDREIIDLEEKHALSTKTLQEHIEQLQKKCAELKQHSMGMEDAMRKDTDTKLQWVTSRKVDLEKEVESLKAVLEMKNKELHTLRVQNLEMEKQLEELPFAREKIKMLQARAEDLEALMAEKTKLERKLSTENQQIRDTYEKESKVNKRLSMENEELLWRIRQAEQSFLSDSFSVAEYPEDVENGSISPTKSPTPHMSRSVFFTYVDKDDQASSPRSQYKKISPGFAASYKTSPYKSSPAPSPRRAKSNSEPPQPSSLSTSTPRKGSKQSNLKQQKKRQRSGSDCGKVSSDQVTGDIAFLSVAGSMTSSVSSESSVFGEQRLLEEHKEQILESLEILREQRSTECPEDSSSKGSSPNLENEDMSRSSEFSDPKTYYHMTFPVSGMPDCDINGTAAQAIHSTSESASPVGDRPQIVPSQEIDASSSLGDCEKTEDKASSVKTAHSSLENVHESHCEKQSKEDRWRTI